MTAYRLRPAALQDLAKIDDYGCKAWGEEASANYLRAIDRALAHHAANPFLGSDRSWVLPGLRKAEAARHHAYFLITDDGIDVLRILHPAMDAGSRLQAT